MDVRKDIISYGMSKRFISVQQCNRVGGYGTKVGHIRKKENLEKDNSFLPRGEHTIPGC